MTTLSSEIVVDAPADAVWRVIAHRFDRMGDWATAVLASENLSPAPSAVGAPVTGRICHTDLRMAPTVSETVVAYDEAARTLTYEASDGMPAFVARARNRWQVTEVAAGRSRVAFHAEVDVRGVLGSVGRWLLSARLARAGRETLDDLKHYVERGVPSARKRRYMDRAARRQASGVTAWTRRKTRMK